MTDTKRNPGKQWTVKRALALAVVCLVAGIAGGWSIRSSRTPALTGPVKATSAISPTPTAPIPSQTPNPARLKEMADAQAAPLIDKVKSNPHDAGLLTSIGNTYYDAQQYPVAIDYYGRVLQARPSDTAVRTDMGTAYWYMGNTDAAIAEFNQALAVAPNNPNALFNLGLAKWKGKRDGAGAIADWKKLLATNPDYEGKGKVKGMMAEAEEQIASAKR